jgi:hypothetical protein
MAGCLAGKSRSHYKLHKASTGTHENGLKDDRLLLETEAVKRTENDGKGENPIR